MFYSVSQKAEGVFQFFGELRYWKKAVVLAGMEALERSGEAVMLAGTAVRRTGTVLDKAAPRGACPPIGPSRPVGPVRVFLVRVAVRDRLPWVDIIQVGVGAALLKTSRWTRWTKEGLVPPERLLNP